MQILRVNTKYNVIWVLGQALPGETNSLLQIYDTLLSRKKLQPSVHFPTYLLDDKDLAEEMLADNVHPFDAEPIVYEIEK